MKFILFAGCFCAAAQVCAHTHTHALLDTVPEVALQTAQVTATRANKKTPIAFTNLNKKHIESLNLGQDIPFILATLPSVTTTSDAGTGIGYTGMRIRGTDPSRINITSNGIPMNDSESHQVFWVNIADFASSLQNIQVQRGAGTSTNGSAAFGASINMQTENLSWRPFATIDASYGSFYTNKQTVKFGTGTLAKHWNFSGRLSHLSSQGYRERASADLGSYFFQGGYFSSNTMLKFITFGGKETTYHAWDGISRTKLLNDRRYNPNGKKSDGTYYEDQDDVYRQNHYQLILNRSLNHGFSYNLALHYTYGKGYYEEYKNNQSFASYALQPFVIDDVKVKKSDLIRRKYLENNFGGTVFSLSFKNEVLDATLGGAISGYRNNHFGRVLWIKSYLASDNSSTKRYYDNTAHKTDANIYARATYNITSAFNLFADLQYRHINYTIEGSNDKYDYNQGVMQTLDVRQPYNFFNPKAGATWQLSSKERLYASFSVAQREPKRKDFTEGYLTRKPLSEVLYDYELGYNYTTPTWYWGANLYFMNYKNQLVNNGQINEIGEFISENVKKSYRLGLEFSAGAKISKHLHWDANATWSRNRILDYTAYYQDEQWDMHSEHAYFIGNTPIAFSPSLIANNTLRVLFAGITTSLTTQYVSRQYLDNTASKENSLNPYCVTHLSLDYKLRLPHVKEAIVGATVYNLFDLRYETNGYSQTSYSVQEGKGYLVHDPRFYPMAGINVLAHLRLSF